MSMNLGIIKHNNQLYMAILHYRDDTGADRQITDTMRKSKDNFTKLFQAVVDTIPDEVQLSEFYKDGYVSQDIVGRADYATKEVAERFFNALEQPQLYAPPGGSMIELRSLQEFDNLKVISESILKKFRDVHPKKMIEDGDDQLTFEEVRFLELLGLEKMALGQFDSKEFNMLTRTKDNTF